MQLASEPALNFYQVARLLCELHDVDVSALADLVTPGISPRRGKLNRRRMYYLLQVGKFVRHHNISRADAERVGWTKLQIIARHAAEVDHVLTPAEIKQLLAFAAEHRVRDLAAALKGKKFVQKRVAHFCLSTRERKLLNKALVGHGAKQEGGRLTGKEEALLKILRQVTDQRA